MKPNRVKLIPLLAVLLVAACGQPVAGEAVAGGEVRVSTSVKPLRPSSRNSSTRPRPTISSRPSTSNSLAGLAGTWEGEYTCGQGNTGLKLTIKEPSGPTLPAVFEFFPLPGNPSAKKGSYSMVGSRSAGGHVVFKQEKWIDQPPGYVMVDLEVTSPIDAGTRQLSGDVLDPSCKGFSVRRP